MRNNAAYLPENPIVYIIFPESIHNRASFAIFVTRLSYYAVSYTYKYNAVRFPNRVCAAGIVARLLFCGKYRDADETL